MVSYESRTSWTSTSPGGDTLPTSAVDEIDVHYPASGDVQLNGLSRHEVASRLRGWREWHVDGRGWSDIGYNMAIDGSGRIWELRGLDRVGAHAASDANPNQNRHSIGVLFVIGNDEQPTTAAINAFRQLRADILDRSPAATTLRGHQQVPGASTACPGDPLMDLIRSGDLAVDPRDTEDDDMTVDQLLEALESDRGQGILANAVSKSLRDGHVTRREFIELVLESTQDPEVRHELATAVLDYENPDVDGGDKTVYRILRDTRAAVTDGSESSE